MNPARSLVLLVGIIALGAGSTRVLAGSGAEGCSLALRGAAPAPSPALELMPIHPDLRRRIQAEGYDSVTILDLRVLAALKQAKQIDEPEPIQQAATGTRPALVLLVDYSDLTHNAVSTPSLYNDLLFSVGTYPAPGSMRDFYREASYGLFDISPGGVDSAWRQVSHSHTYYANADGIPGTDDDYGFGTYPQNAQGLVVDAVTLADPYVNFANYAVGGQVQGLFVIHTGRGAETNTAKRDWIWSHMWSLGAHAVTVDGVLVNIYSMEPEYVWSPGDSTVGVFCHEYGHVLGLPDLYDTDYSSEGLGNWSLMAGGSWNPGNGSSPAHPDAWSKIQLGWVSPQIPTGTQNGATLPNVEDNQVIYRLWTNGAFGTEYFLLENRQRRRFDAGLPGDGLLLYHVDENGFQTDDWHPLVMLEQADGRWDLQYGRNRGDGGDPYPGTSSNRNATAASSPNTRSYAGADTLVNITNMSNSGLTMTADISVSDLPDYVVSAVTRDDSGVRQPGESIQVSWTTQNLGAGAASSSSTTSIYLSADTTITPSDIWLYDVSTPALNAGASDSHVSVAITVPPSTPAGIYYLGAIADRTNTIAESGEGNNTRVDGAVIVASSLIANAGPNKTIAPGGSVTLEGSASGGLPPYTYSWSPQAGVSNPNIAQPAASPSTTTTYTLTVTDSVAQTASDTVIVFVLDRFDVQVIAAPPEPQGGDVTQPLAFAVRVDARDASDALVTGYSGTATLTSNVGTASPSSLSISSGAWEGQVTIAADLDPPCHLTATDQSDPGITGTSPTFSLCGKGDPTADSAVNVLDVVRAVQIALGQSVVTPPRLEFQSWAADVNNTGDVNVLDVIRIVNKIMGVPGTSLKATSRASAATAGPVALALVSDGRGAWILRVSNATGMAGVQFEVSDRQARVSAGELTANASWQVQSNRTATGTRVIAFSPTATGLPQYRGDLLRLTNLRGKPRLTNVTLSDAAGRALQAR